MPDYHYVSSAHGTATSGDHPLTLQTGNITSITNTSVYTTIENCLNNATVADGDFILVCDNHSYTAGASTNITYVLGVDITAYIISVDNTGVETYKKATTYQERSSITSNWDISLSGNYSRFIFHGIYLQLGQADAGTHDLNFNGIGMAVEFYDSFLHFSNTSSSTSIEMGNDGQLFKLVDTWLHFGAVAQEINPHDGAVIIFDGVTSSGTAVNHIIGSLAIIGGIIVDIQNSRLDQLIVTNGELYEAFSNSMEWGRTTIRNCLVPSGFEWIDPFPTKQTQFETLMESFGTADEYYNFYYANIAGVVEEDTTQYLTTGATYDGINEFSLKFTPSTDDIDVNVSNPLRYLIAILPAQDLSSAVTLTSELVSADSGLTNVDAWIEAEVQDGTNQALGKRYSSRAANILGSGTSLSASSGVWAVTTNTEYDIDLALSAEAGSTNSYIKVYGCVAKPNIVVNFDSAVVVT